MFLGRNDGIKKTFWNFLIFSMHVYSGQVITFIRYTKLCGFRNATVLQDTTRQLLLHYLVNLWSRVTWVSYQIDLLYLWACYPKGQTNLNWFFRPTFLPKKNERIWLYYYDTSGWLVFVHFLEEIEHTKNTFRTYLTSSDDNIWHLFIS